MNNIKQYLKEKFKKYCTKQNIAGATALLISGYFFKKAFEVKIVEKTKLSYFLTALSQNLIKEVFIQGKTLIFKSPNSETWFQTNASLLTKDRLYKLLDAKKDSLVFSCEKDHKPLSYINLAIVGLSYYLAYKLVTSMLVSKVESNSQFKEEMQNEKTRFSDIYGIDHAKQQLQEIINYLNEPKQYEEMGARLRKGVLLYGPSGTGKTMLARATAGESQAKFIYCTASEFVELYVGIGAKRVRQLFEKARKLSPAIIFIDEIDGIGVRRKFNFGDEHQGDMERASTLNQLLTEMDGFRQNENIVVIAATNRILSLDDALLRSGRFDCKIQINMPNQEERAGIINIHLKNKKNQVSEETVQKIAEDSNNFSGADIENVVNEGAYCAVKQQDKFITDEDLMTAYEKVKFQKQVNLQSQH